jgi:hypothetical protein
VSCNPGCLEDAGWFLWDTSAPLPLSFADGANVGAVWFPVVPVPITLTFSPTPLVGSATYIANASGLETGAELVPIPTGVAQVTLSAGSGESIWVYFSNTLYNPFKGDAILFPQADTQADVPADGVATTSTLVAVTFPRPYNVQPVVNCTPTSPTTPTAGLSAQAVNVTTEGFEIFCSGGDLGSTTSVGWDAIGT